MLLSITTNAHKLQLIDFHHDSKDATASVKQIVDLNGTPCALIMVDIIANNVSFEGDIMKVVDKGSGEYWVYMIDGASWIKIQTSDFIPFRYEFEPLQKLQTYIMQFTHSSVSDIRHSSKESHSMNNGHATANAGNEESAAIYEEGNRYWKGNGVPTNYSKAGGIVSEILELELLRAEYIAGQQKCESQ